MATPTSSSTRLGPRGTHRQAVPDACVELVIVEWTGRPPDGTLDAGGKGFALGNDALQLIEALVEADHDKNVCSVSFREGDADRGGAGTNPPSDYGFDSGPDVDPKLPRPWSPAFKT